MAIARKEHIRRNPGSEYTLSGNLDGNLLHGCCSSTRLGSCVDRTAFHPPQRGSGADVRRIGPLAPAVRLVESAGSLEGQTTRRPDTRPPNHNTQPTFVLRRSRGFWYITAPHDPVAASLPRWLGRALVLGRRAP